MSVLERLRVGEGGKEKDWVGKDGGEILLIIETRGNSSKEKFALFSDRFCGFPLMMECVAASPLITIIITIDDDSGIKFD